MKYILMLTCGFIFCFTLSNTSSKKRESSRAPKALCSGQTESWVLSKVSAPGFVKVEPEPGVLAVVKARFDTDGHFIIEFQKKDTVKAILSHTVIEGVADFRSNTDGSNVLITHATQGRELVTENGVKISKPVDAGLLKTIYSNTYLWERMSFADIPTEDFLLLVNLDEHPTANSKIKGSIDKKWVSKLYIR